MPDKREDDFLTVAEREDLTRMLLLDAKHAHQSIAAFGDAGDTMDLVDAYSRLANCRSVIRVLCRDAGTIVLNRCDSDE